MSASAVFRSVLAESLVGQSSMPFNVKQGLIKILGATQQTTLLVGGCTTTAELQQASYIVCCMRK